MAAIQVGRQIQAEDAQAALSEALDPGYRVSVSSPSSLKVTRNFLIWGTVHMSCTGDSTSFRVRPGGLIVVAAFNALYTVPKIREALGRAFSEAA